VLLALICWGAPHVRAEDRPSTFEAASVKPAPPPVNGADYRLRGGPGTDDPGQITYPRVGLVGLLMQAYGVRMDQISGPEWIQSELYSIVAKIPPNTSKDEFNVMLRSLLADRFGLKLHHESREFRGYWLTVANAVKLAESSARLDALKPLPKGFSALGPGAKMAIAMGAGPLYGIVRSTHRQTMPEFAEALGAMVNMSNGDGVVRGSPPLAHVFDKTGLNGEFYFTLEFAGSMMPGGANESLAPNLFVALGRLGLKLEAGEGSLDVLVIDRVEKVPSEN
jgi:uncharacterized protein (TIGR03435 family)